MHNYTEEEIKDIQQREKIALEYLAKMQLTPACVPQLVNISDDTYGIKLHPFLNDSKYSSKVSPIQVNK